MATVCGRESFRVPVFHGKSVTSWDRFIVIIWLKRYLGFGRPNLSHLLYWRCIRTGMNPQGFIETHCLKHWACACQTPVHFSGIIELQTISLLNISASKYIAPSLEEWQETAHLIFGDEHAHYNWSWCRRRKSLAYVLEFWTIPQGYNNPFRAHIKTPSPTFRLLTRRIYRERGQRPRTGFLSEPWQLLPGRRLGIQIHACCAAHIYVHIITSKFQ